MTQVVGPHPMRDCGYAAMHPVVAMYIPHNMMRLLDGIDVAKLYGVFALTPDIRPTRQ